jgi:hypothetical protein
MAYALNFSNSRDRTLYAQIMTNPRTIANTSGVWTSTNTQRVRFNTFGPAAVNALNSPTYKTGFRSRLQGIRGRQGGSWTLQKPFFPSGTAGTRPDDDPILQAIFGATGAVSAGVSVTYSLTDALNYLLFVDYNKTPGLTNPTNRYVMGAIPQSVKFTGGANFLDMEISGSAVGVGDSVNFPYTLFDAVLAGKGTGATALSTFPAEPTVTVNGNILPGFGSGAGFTIGGSTVYEVRATAEINMEMGVEGVSDAVTDPYTIGFLGGERLISVSNITCIDSDSTLLNALKAAAFTKAPQTLGFVFGNVAGSIVTINLKNVQIGNASWRESGAGLNIQFGSSGANATDTTAPDEMNIVLT